MKIRIAIIEDEFYARQAIKKYISQLGEPYEVCGEASNGRDGLELIRRLKPEIALVDITMPVMNGIDMMHHVQEEALPTQMIILTGYSDFSYARAAVRLGVREYLLKPLRIEELRSALEHVTKSLSRNKSAAPDGIDMENLLGSQLAEQLTRSGADSVDTGLLLEHLDFPRDSGTYYVVLIQFYTEKTDASIMARLSAMALDTLHEKDFPAVGYSADSRSLCLVINVPKDKKAGALNSTLEEMAEAMYNQLSVQLKIAMSGGCSSLSMIHDAHLEAQAVQHYHLFCNSRQVAFYTADTLIRSPSALFDSETRHNLTMLLRRQDAAAVKKFIDDRFSLISRSQASSDAVYLCAAEMVSAIFEYNSTRFEDTGDLSAPGNALPALFSINHVDALKKFIVDRAMEAIGRGAADEIGHAALIRKVHDYIDENFANSALRLEDVARANFISTQYLCSIYRKATRSTIGDYLFEVRMRHAQQLIGDGQRNVTAISEACGYDDPGYFCKCFRKKYGMTPRQYIESQNT